MGFGSTNTQGPLAAELDAHKSAKNNPHGVTASQVGLGEVPNVSTNDQKPTYSVASALAALTSGETLSVAFGKIAKAVSELITHIGTVTGNPHKVTAAEAGAVPTSRKINGKALSTDITLSASDVGALPTTGGTMSGAITMGNNKITGLATPTATTDAATKGYVDGLLSWKDLNNGDIIQISDIYSTTRLKVTAASKTCFVSGMYYTKVPSNTPPFLGMCYVNPRGAATLTLQVTSGSVTVITGDTIKRVNYNDTIDLSTHYHGAILFI